MKTPEQIARDTLADSISVRSDADKDKMYHRLSGYGIKNMITRAIEADRAQRKEETGLHFSGSDPTEEERARLNRTYRDWEAEIDPGSDNAEARTAAAFIVALMQYAGVSEV